MKPLPVLTTLLFVVYVVNIIVGKVSLLGGTRFKPLGIPDKWSALLLFVISILFSVMVLRSEAKAIREGTLRD